MIAQVCIACYHDRLVEASTAAIDLGYCQILSLMALDNPRRCLARSEVVSDHLSLLDSPQCPDESLSVLVLEMLYGPLCKLVLREHMHFIGRKHMHQLGMFFRHSLFNVTTHFILKMRTILEDSALVLDDGKQSSLVVADLHLGFSAEMSAAKGVAIPAEHDAMRLRLESLIRKHHAVALYILGDVKHTLSADRSFNWKTIPEFVGSISSMLPVTLIPGNHDGDLEALLPRSVTVTNVRGIVIGPGDSPVGLFHGHAWPSEEVLSAGLVVTGHQHPSIRRTRSAPSPVAGVMGVKRSLGTIPVVMKGILDTDCVRRNLGLSTEHYAKRAELVVLPSFNPLVSGIALNDRNPVFDGPVFERGCIDLLASEVFSVDGILLGTVRDLQQAQRNN